MEVPWATGGTESSALGGPSLRLQGHDGASLGSANGTELFATDYQRSTRDLQKIEHRKNNLTQ